MILGYMKSHMYPSESQYVATCLTSVEAFSILCQCHEKRSGLTIIQIIQWMIQICFDPNINDTNLILVTVQDLIYCAEMIGPIDYTKLALLFMMMSLRSTHPSVHEALAPALMEGTLTLQALERRLTYFHDLQVTQSLEHMVFSANTSSPPLSTLSSPTSPTIALPAYPPRANICPNCKCQGHSIEFCISLGGKMEGYTPSDAIAQQRAVRDGLRNCPSLPAAPTAPPISANPNVKVDPDSTVWVNGVKYQPSLNTKKASVATIDVETAMTAADQGEYDDWATNNNADWGDSEPFNTATFLLAASDTSLITQDSPPLYLDSGASTHISCVRSDFTEFTNIELWTITGIGIR